ncbi:hypothetical protein ACLOJK_038949 [Asimina triloba]
MASSGCEQGISVSRHPDLTMATTESPSASPMESPSHEEHRPSMNGNRPNRRQQLHQADPHPRSRSIQSTKIQPPSKLASSVFSSIQRPNGKACQPSSLRKCPEDHGIRFDQHLDSDLAPTSISPSDALAGDPRNPVPTSHLRRPQLGPTARGSYASLQPDPTAIECRFPPSQRHGHEQRRQFHNIEQGQRCRYPPSTEQLGRFDIPLHQRLQSNQN